MSNAPLPDPAALAAMPLPTLLLDLEQRVSACSPSMAQAFPELQVQPGEMLEALFNPRDRRGSRGFHRALSKHAGGVLACEVTLREQSPVRLHLSQADTGWVLCLIDLAQERQDQSHLRGIKGELSAILSCMGDGLLILDPEQRLKDVNQAAQRCFRFASAHGIELSTEALIGRGPELLFGEHAERISACVDRVSQDPDHKESLALKVKERSLMLSFNPIFVPKKGYAGACITVRDLSEIEGLHAHLRRVMDSVQQGLFTLDLQAQIQPEFSAMAIEHFPQMAAGLGFDELLDTLAPAASQAFALQWEQLTWGFLPLELCLDQLPKQAQIGDRVIRLEWSGICDGNENLEQVLVLSTDITDLLAAKLAKALQEESFQAFQAIGRDRFGFIAFHRDASAQVAQISKGPVRDRQGFEHALHTLKGNAGMMGFRELMRLCHELEQSLVEREDPCSVDCTPLIHWWDQLNSHIEGLLGQDSDGLHLEAADLEMLERALKAQLPYSQLLEQVQSWHREPLRRSLNTLARRAEYLAIRLDKPGLQVHIEHDNTRLAAEHFAPLWSSRAHALRNALDHGIEAPEQRLAPGKSAHGQLWLRARKEGAQLVVEIEDDGAGVDWDTVRTRAQRAGLPAESTSDLVAALLLGGVSTRQRITQISGRGVGVGAVGAAMEALGGQLEILSTRGQGTCLRCTAPIDGSGLHALAS
jgi:HPt (histidine-containing phosphotransfer) domain-containing protein/PAS domain-containing protein